MKLFRFIMSGLLALCLIVMPVVSSANVGSTTAPTPAKSLPTDFKFPPIGEITKRMVSRANVVNYAVESLLGAVDWVLDPTNNRIVYKDKRDEIYSTSHIKLGMEGYVDSKDYEYIANLSCQKHGIDRVYSGKDQRQEHSQLINVWCINSVTRHPAGTAVFYAYNEEKHDISYEQVAEQIIKNAQAGHAESVDFVVAMSVEKADSDTADSDKEKDEAEEKPKTDKPIKTGNPDLDEVFKDAYPKSEGTKDYQYPGTREELERDLKNANPEKYEEEIRDDGSKVTKTKFSDGFRVNIYPGRKSKDFKETGWEIRKPNGNDIYKGTTK